MIMNTVLGILLGTAAILLASPLSKLFVGYDQDLCEMTTRGMQLLSISFFFCAYAIFGSSFFTALNDGIVSAIISFLRTVLFQVGAVMILPMFLGLDGIWYSITVAEIGSMLVTFYYLMKKRKKYCYY